MHSERSYESQDTLLFHGEREITTDIQKAADANHTQEMTPNQFVLDRIYSVHTVPVLVWRAQQKMSSEGTGPKRASSNQSNRKMELREDHDAEQLLRGFVDGERSYAVYLTAIEQQFSRRLRFQSCAGLEAARCVGSCLKHDEFVQSFVTASKELLYLHSTFVERLKQALSHAPQEARSVADRRMRITRLVEIVLDLLIVVRVVYGRLFCQTDALQNVLQTANDQASMVVRELPMHLQLPLKEFAERPLQRFHEMVAFADALVSVIEEDDALQEHASSLTRCALESREYIEQVKTDAREERELIALQTRFDGAGQVDLCGKKIMVQGEVNVALLQSYGHEESSLQTTALWPNMEKLQIHCFNDGSIFYSRILGCDTKKIGKNPMIEMSRYAICGRQQLNQDAVFMEVIPDVISDRAFALICGQQCVIIELDDASEARQWIDVISGLLEQNEARSQILRQGRSADNLPIPSELVKQLSGSHEKPLVTFPSFHDDDLPGVFWMQNLSNEDGKQLQELNWVLVEVALYANWLLISQINGWKDHQVIHSVDTAESGLDITDSQSGNHDWSLILSSSGSSEITLLSKKRTRIDFWFDQVSKSIERARTAAKKAKEQAEEEEAKRLAAEEAARVEQQAKIEEAAQTSVPVENVAPKSSGGFINVRQKKKRLSNTIVIDAPVSIETPSTEKQDTSNVPEPEPAIVSANEVSTNDVTSDAPIENSSTKPKGRARSKRTKGDEQDGANTDPKGDTLKSPAKKRKVAATMDSLVQAAEDALSADTNEDEPPSTQIPASQQTQKRARRAATMKSPLVKTPKHRWLKRKTEEPADAGLTQSSQDTTIGDSGSGTDVPPNPSLSTVISDTGPEIRIILTGIEPTPSVRKKIKAIKSGVYEDDVTKATHVIAPKNALKRTVKMLCGISCCAHILDERWLDESARAGYALDEHSYCLHDAVAESKWKFDLKKTMYSYTSEQRRQLFCGHTVFITNHKSILPPVKDLVNIVECAGGQATMKGTASASDLVITSKAALGVASVQKSLVNADPQKMFSPELILSSILQQHIEFGKHHVFALSNTTLAKGKRR